MRKLKNIAGAKAGIVGLADDGTTWLFTDTEWKQLPEIPQPEKKAHDRVNGERNAAVEILEFLNVKAGRNYRAVDANLALIAARIREGYTVQECKQVIAIQVRAWRDDEKMEEFLRPATLFNKTNFSNYAGKIEKE